MATKAAAAKQAAPAAAAPTLAEVPVLCTADTAKKALPKIPKKLGDLADQLDMVEKARLAMAKAVEVYEAREKEIKEIIINTLPKSNTTGVAGHLCRVRVENKDVVRVMDWEVFHEYIIKNAKKDPGVWGMLQRRVNDSTVLEVLNAGKLVPGCEKIPVPVVRKNKL
jgi:hypothetical protein